MTPTIRPLTDFTADDLRHVITSYTTSERYVVDKTAAGETTTFTIRLEKLPQPLHRQHEQPDEDMLAMYRAALQHNLSLGAYDGEKLIGIALAEPHHWNGSLWVWEFHVAESHRGQGIGRDLMEALAQRAKAAGLRVIVCETQNINVPAVRFYGRVGFTLDAFDLCYYTNADWPDGDIAFFMKRKI